MPCADARLEPGPQALIASTLPTKPPTPQLTDVVFVQDDWLSVEDSGRESRISWAWSGTQTRDYLDEELRYDRHAGAITPVAITRDGSYTPSHTEALLMTPDPLVDTPHTADYLSTQSALYTQQHSLQDALPARRALVH